MTDFDDDSESADSPIASTLSRRALVAGGVVAATAFSASTTQAAEKSVPRFRYCFNTSTIRGQKLSVPEQIDVAIAAGYDGIEPWIPDLDAYQKSGGKLADLRKRLDDGGLKVESAIGFANWIVDDDAKRAQGLEDAKRDMGWIAELGGTRIAAPPAGATDNANLDLRRAAERYRALLELGDKTGVTPQCEVWGFSKCLSKLAETMFVVIESGHPKACVLPDVYHLFKGGTAFDSLAAISATVVHCFHMNDYPALDREKAKDADRVYPGDGTAPIAKVLRTLAKNSARPVLSLELFNPEYWKLPALDVAKTGLAKMKGAVQAAAVEE